MKNSSMFEPKMAQELDAFEQGIVRRPGFFQHAALKFQQAQLAVNVERWIG